MAMVRSRNLTLNSVGEEVKENKETKKSLNLSVSSINDLIQSMSTSSTNENLNDYDEDDVFANKNEVKDVLGKAFGGSKGSGSGASAQDISDNAMRALFAKRAARTIHGSLKQRMKSNLFIFAEICLHFRLVW